ncbi:MAG: DinB family protein [Dehalococcoidia bacterium]|nr:DinB family protein [Dehalococcoidia bacterium]
MSDAASGLITQQRYLVFFIRRLFGELTQAIADLSVEDLNHLPHEHANSIGFNAWHVFRTADNVVLFAFERERPLWVQQGLDAAWGLPRVAQGTGMDPAEARALRFPEAAKLTRYAEDVRDEICKRIVAMSDDYLQGITKVNPWGEISRLEAIGQTVIAHGNGHLGQVSLARTLLGKPGLDI